MLDALRYLSVLPIDYVTLHLYESKKKNSTDCMINGLLNYRNIE